MTGTEDKKSDVPEKVPTKTTAPRRKVADDVPREDLSAGVLRTSRIGPMEWTNYQGATPEQLEDLRHTNLKDSLQPGDEGYNPHKDPLVPTSTMAREIATEIQGLGESPTWNALHEAEELAAEDFSAARDARNKRLNHAA